MSAQACSIEGCTRSLHGRGWCATHYQRWRTHGDPEVCTTNRYVPMHERFWMKVQKSPDCWLWTAASLGGYGVFTESHGGKQHKAHRFAYELLVGPIPEGLVIDHRCRTTLCVNPSHLRPVTIKQNNEHKGGPTRLSTTGVLGVSYQAKSKRYMAMVGHNGERVYGGLYATIEEAAVAVKALRLSLFTHNDVDRKAS